MFKELSFLKLLTDENRLRILLLLCQKELSVCQLMVILDISQPLISRNLSILTRSSILVSRKSGKHIFYSCSKKLTKFQTEIINYTRLEMKKSKEVKNDCLLLKTMSQMAKQKNLIECNMDLLKRFKKIRKNILDIV